MQDTSALIDECRELQREELQVLESIYPDYVSSEIDTSKPNGSIKLEIPIELDAPRNVLIQGPSDSNNLTLSLLPPLLVHVILPQSYPLQVSPQLISIRATHLWMNFSAHFHQLLIDMWQKGEGVLYNWIEFIRSGKFLEELGMIKEDRILVIDHSTPQLLIPLLISFEETAKSDEFNQNSYPCSICLTSLKGSKCLRLSCNHVFCRSCLEDFWGLCIQEGDISRVGCPDPECVKQGRPATEEEVSRAVPEEAVVRWRWLKEKAMMDKDPTISVCPMVLCQKPVPKPQINDDEESGWHRLRTCPSCSYSFCSFCKRTWHGPVSACPISAYETLVLDYLALPENSPGRRTIEQRFGRIIVAKMVAAYHEEQATKQWLADNGSPCPGCNVHIEKSVGCNHMTCSKCKQHFCYRCGTKLPASSPYQHFSTPDSRCFNKLFDFVSEEENEWQPMVGFLAI